MRACLGTVGLSALLARLLVPAVGLWLVACTATQNAAARDPMRCERNPECASKHGLARDCTTQCNDDPACMDRCREMQQDHLGAPQ